MFTMASLDLQAAKEFGALDKWIEPGKKRGIDYERDVVMGYECIYDQESTAG
jgi:hypothetical protein